MSRNYLADVALVKCAALLIWLLIPVAQIHAQTRADFKQADAELNKTYQALLAKLPDAASKQKLKEEQRAWITSRDVEAASAADEARGGSMAPTLRYETMTHLTRERIKELEAMLEGAAPNKKGASMPEPSVSSAPTASVPPKESEGEQTKSVLQTPEPTASSSPSSISPDKKWEYQPPGEETGAKIVKAGTKEVAEDLCDISSCGEATVLWAPDSKRFAFNWGQGRTRQTAFYQLRDDQWVALEFPSNDDIFEKQPNDIVAGQLKKEGLSEKKLEKQGKFLRLIWSTMKVDRWLDSNTAIVHVSLQQVAARRNAPGEMDNGYGADLLYTLKFDVAGKWKIVKTHRMSDKEVEKEDAGER